METSHRDAVETVDVVHDNNNNNDTDDDNGEGGELQSAQTTTR